MKKITFLLFIALLPIFGFGQTNLVRWNGANLQPNPLIIASNIGAGSLGGTYVVDNYSNPFPGFRGSGYNNSSTTPDFTNYFEFPISANSGYQIALQRITLTYVRSDGGPQKFQVWYSTNSSAGTQVGSNISVAETENTTNISLTGITVASGTTGYIRIYPFNRENASWTGGTFHIKHGTTYSGATPDTSGPTIRGTVSAVSCTASTAPTTITGVNNVCPGSNITLVASGGTHGTSAVYEWSTNASFTQIIAGQSTATLTHTPTANSTTYWVRRKDAAPCTVATTSSVSKTVTRSTPGDQTTYGNDSWIGYAYTWSGTPAATTYIGYVTEATTFDRDLTSGSITGASGITNLCSTPVDNFFVRYKMTKNFAAGSYTFTVGGDDGYRLSVDGGVNFVMDDNWDDHGYEESTVTVCLNGSTNLVLEYFENGGGSRVRFDYTAATSPTAPTAITGTTTICTGESTTLTANVTGGTYQWGTGTVGSNVIAGQTANAITVSPTVNTTYWVRKVSCPGYTNAATVDVIVGPIGNPGDFGINAWNVYGYNQATLEPVAANYRGFYTQNTLSVNTTTAWGENASPASAATTPTNTAYQGCSLPNDNFTFVHKRQGFPAGSYELRMVAWDDDTRVYVNGVQVEQYNGWYGGTPQNNLLGVYCLDAASTIEVRTLEGGGGALLTMNVVPVSAVYNNGWTATATDHSVEIQSSMTLDSDLQVCSCTVKAGQTLTIEPNSTLTVIGDITVEAGGKIVVESDGALIQVNEDAKYNDNGVKNSFTAKRNTQLVYRYDFTYWSSPLADTDPAVTDPAWKFTLKKLSPLTLFNKYFRWSEAGQAWQINTNGTDVMTPGRGYIVRAPQTFNVQGETGAAPSTHTALFVGTPNTGTVTYSNVQGSTVTESKWNLLGNPYPSAINVKEFLLENQAVLDGTIYLWTHNTNLSQNQSSGTYSYSPSDYASYNFSGSVASAPGAGDDAENDGLNSMTPNEFLSPGQGFFVKGKIGATANSTVTFRNSMREKTAVNQFFKPGPTEPINDWTTTGQHRVWLNLTGGTSAFNQTLVGYIEDATDGLDWGFDGSHFGGNQVSLYSLVESKNMVIQGRALPFNDQDQVPLGYKTTLTGTLKIAIDHFDGLFNGQDIYLEDKTLNIVHNLKEADYTFTTVPGTFNDRFVLRYVPAAELGTDNPTVDANSMVIFRNGSQINIKSNDQTIEHVTVYDLLGKVIFDKSNINAQSFSTSQLNVSNQVVIVKVITDTQAEVVKKVIMN